MSSTLTNIVFKAYLNFLFDKYLEILMLTFLDIVWVLFVRHLVRLAMTVRDQSQGS
jgi:hypothetical protein